MGTSLQSAKRCRSCNSMDAVLCWINQRPTFLTSSQPKEISTATVTNHYSSSKGLTNSSRLLCLMVKDVVVKASLELTQPLKLRIIYKILTRAMQSKYFTHTTETNIASVRQACHKRAT
ncbi:hypothetical protein PoB_003043800 [Plakobranchus ocellatus]|uniref:Uncharacterized protein n=1 Tax=Plakobranchus ocellatus TaxID=259542 RepID=A0AAV4AB10_9GAST|nr:hypothetical protein PoB_003043800 [Plakobranchus ocellatus]